MAGAQEMEWSRAQEIAFSVDLVKAAKHQLQFLAIVDRNCCLYDGPILDRAIYRYNNCWLPLLAKHLESSFSEGPLVVPLDCEWIWHCHRLNPVQYKQDCEEMYGKILDKFNVLSSFQGARTNQTEWIWKIMYPTEPYALDLSNGYSPVIIDGSTVGDGKSTEYDLVGAVKRQSSFFSKISGYVSTDDDFLKEAVAKYKAFLHLIKRDKELNPTISSFHVPTREIDLIWHAHQLHPAAYAKDLKAILGKVLDHNDRDPKRSKGIKLDVGFAATSKLWEETYGQSYQDEGGKFISCGCVDVGSKTPGGGLNRKEQSECGGGGDCCSGSDCADGFVG